MACKTIAELAEDKATLLGYLDDINHEINRRAGEVDPLEDDEDEPDPSKVETATDKTPKRSQKATSTP